MHGKHLATLEVNARYLCVGCVVATYNLSLWSQGDPSGVMTASMSAVEINYQGVLGTGPVSTIFIFRPNSEGSKDL